MQVALIIGVVVVSIAANVIPVLGGVMCAMGLGFAALMLVNMVMTLGGNALYDKVAAPLLNGAYSAVHTFLFGCASAAPLLPSQWSTEWNVDKVVRQLLIDYFGPVGASFYYFIWDLEFTLARLSVGTYADFLVGDRYDDLLRSCGRKNVSEFLYEDDELQYLGDRSVPTSADAFLGG